MWRTVILSSSIIKGLIALSWGFLMSEFYLSRLSVLLASGVCSVSLIISTSTLVNLSCKLWLLEFCPVLIYLLMLFLLLVPSITTRPCSSNSSCSVEGVTILTSLASIELIWLAYLSCLGFVNGLYNCTVAWLDFPEQFPFGYSKSLFLDSFWASLEVILPSTAVTTSKWV